MVGVCALIAVVAALLGSGCGALGAAPHGQGAAGECAHEPRPDRTRPSRPLVCRPSTRSASADSKGEITAAAIMSLVPWRTSTPRLIVTAVASAVALLTPSASSGATLPANPATLDSVFAGANPGDRIQLAAGNYGEFSGGIKPGIVTLAPAPGANATMELEFNPAANITIEGVTVTGGLISDTATRNITISNSDVPGQIWLDTRYLNDANILLANNVFRDWDTCDGCGEARVFLTGGTQPSGVTIRDSEFYGGLSDGIQNGSNGTRIIGNEFHHIEPGSPSGVHADAIQLYGSRNTIIRGNYMHDQPEVPFIMAPDGADHELIEDNVVEGSSHGYPYITLFSDDSSIVRHNTFADGDCAFNLACGVLRLGAKDADDPGRGTVIEDNILSEISIEGATTIARRSHNLLAHDAPAGAAEIRGRPTYVGGPTPTAYANYLLAPGSLGRRSASDQLDRGARIAAATPTMPGGDADDGCRKARSKVKKAKRKVKRAKRRVHRANGDKQVRKAHKKLRRAKKHLRRAKKHKRHAC